MSKQQEIALSKLIAMPLLEQKDIIDQFSHQPDHRQQFSSHLAYVLSVVGFAAGYGSFWRFPSLVYEHGGGAFLIPYIITMLFLGIPLLYLETVVGQMNQSTIPRIFQRVNNGLKMFGYTIILIPLGVAVYYNTLLTYSYRLIFVCFLNPLPFLNEEPTSNEYFRNNILHKSSGIQEFGTVHWELAVLFIVSLFICYESIRHGIEMTGKILIFTVIAPYVFLIFLMIRGISLDGSLQGLVYLFTPDFSKIFTGKIWMDATVQVFFQISIASAGLINFASLKQKKSPFMSIIYLVPISITICGLLCGAVIFMYVGHFANMNNLTINDLTLSGQQLAFSVVPKAISLLPWANLWLFIFSLILVMLGLDTQFGFIEAVAGAFQYQLKSRDGKLFGHTITTKHMYLCICIFMGVFFPLFTSSAGIYYLQYFDSFVADINLPFGALIELYVFVYLFDFNSTEEEVLINTGTKTPRFIGWALRSKLMVIVLSSIVFIGITHQVFLYETYSTGKYIFGWVITLYPNIIALTYWRMYKNDDWRVNFKQIEEFEVKEQKLGSRMIQLV